MSTTEKELTKTLDERSVVGGFSRVRVSMIVTDPHQEDNPIIYVNDAFCRMTGYSRQEVLGQNCRFMQGEGTDKRDVDHIRRAVSEGRDVSVDIVNYRANGQAFNNRLILAPISDESGGTRYYLGIQKEVGANEMESLATTQAAKLNLLRERVTSDLSLLLRTIPEPDDDGDLEFDAIHRRMDCLQLAYEEMLLLDTHHVEAGIDLGALVSRVGAAITHENCPPGVRYTQSIERVQADLETSVRVSLLVSEFLSNAYNHAFERMEQGFVQLQVSNLEAGGLRIMVSDDGVGIPKDQEFPDKSTRDGRLIQELLGGLGTSVNLVRGAAGSVFIIDVPLGG